MRHGAFLILVPDDASLPVADHRRLPVHRHLVEGWDNTQYSFETYLKRFETYLKRFETYLKRFETFWNDLKCFETVWNVGCRCIATWCEGKTTLSMVLKRIWKVFKTVWNVLKRFLNGFKRFEMVWNVLKMVWKVFKRFETWAAGAALPPSVRKLSEEITPVVCWRFFSHLHSQKSKNVLIKDPTFSSLNFSFSQTNSQLLPVGLNLIFFYSGFLATCSSGFRELFFNTVLFLLMKL